MKNIVKPATSEKQAKHDSAEQPVKQDLIIAFEKPAAYLRGELKRLRAFHSGEWWLNVDYLESHSAC